MADTWTMLPGYTPSDYVDTMVFEVVSATKKIRPLSGQTLVAGEKNSQYVRFEMDRFWDGIDISDKNFSITYALAGKYYGTSEAVSAEVSTDKLRFGWIAPEEACCIAGTLMFVLVIKSDGYVLKTQIAETPVVKSLDEESVVPEPTREAWYKEFQARVQADLDASQAALTSAQDALTRANTANDAASSALTAASEANLAAQDAIVVAKERYGSPLVANAGPEMVDTNRVYVFTGSESAYTYGHWYYYDNGVWNDGGVYNGNGVNTDKTLSIENMPADAKKTGDEISELKSGLSQEEARAKAEEARIEALFTMDVEEAVSDWLDAHPEATTTVDFSIAVKVFPTVADMVADSTLKNGDNVATRGYYASGDNGGANYVISASHSGIFYIELTNGLYANLLVENKYISTDIIGLRHYATEELALADTSGMINNNTIVAKAFEAGFSLLFGYGYYAFNNYIQIYSSDNSIIGSGKYLTSLIFPNSVGLYFDRAVEYHYMEFKNFKIKSDGDCIKIISNVYNVILCEFYKLYLDSKNGECIVAPPHNEGHRGSTDTCVWACYFRWIHARSGAGAMVANVKGLGLRFEQFMMLGDTHIAFRNCSGYFRRFDTGCEDAQIAFYYDDPYDHGLTLHLEEFHFEAPSRSFIYTEDSVLSEMGIGIYAVDSGCTRPQMVDSEIPWIKVGTLKYLYHYGAYNMLPPESLFNMTALNGAIIHASNISTATLEEFKSNIGGKDGLKIYDVGVSKLYKFYTGTTGERYRDSGNADYEVLEVNHALRVNNIYGGREHQLLTISDDMLPAESAKRIDVRNIDPCALFCDCVDFKLTDSTDTNTITIRNLQTNENNPGKILTIRNNPASVKNIKLEAVPTMTASVVSYGFYTPSNITLQPGDSIHVMQDYEATGGTGANAYKFEWHPFTLSYNPT